MQNTPAHLDTVTLCVCVCVWGGGGSWPISWRVNARTEHALYVTLTISLRSHCPLPGSSRCRLPIAWLGSGGGGVGGMCTLSPSLLRHPRRTNLSWSASLGISKQWRHSPHSSLHDCNPPPFPSSPPPPQHDYLPPSVPSSSTVVSSTKTPTSLFPQTLLPQQLSLPPPQPPDK